MAARRTIFRRRVFREEKQTALRRPLPTGLLHWLDSIPAPHESGPTTYYRFAIADLHPDSGQFSGVFAAAHWLRTSKELSPPEKMKLERSLRWFSANLTVPKDIPDLAIFWFRPDASTCIHRMWNLVRLLRYHGRKPRLQRTDNPGRIIYRDAQQVAAIPRHLIR